MENGRNIHYTNGTNQVGGAKYVVASPQISLKLTEKGEVIGVTFTGKKIDRAVYGQTSLAGFQIDGQVAAKKLEDGGIQFKQILKNHEQQLQCTLTERFIPTNESIRWETEIYSINSPWSTSICSDLRYPGSDDVKFWTAWSDPEQVPRQNDWNDPLVPQALKDMTLWYGAPKFEVTDPQWWWIPFNHGRLFCIPMATMLEPKEDIGLSLVLSLNDTLREISLSTTTKGDMTFSRYRNRLGGGRTVKFSMDIAVHEADWRGGLRWISNRYPEFFNPPNPKAHEIAGCAAYSPYTGELDVEKLRKMGFKVNWRASWYHPYQGMILPPVPDETDEWEGVYDGRKVSRKAMNDYNKTMHSLGFSVLDYFNVSEYGKHIKGQGLNAIDAEEFNNQWTNEYKQPAIEYTADKDVPEDKLWENCMDYLIEKVSDGILFHPNGYTYIENGEKAIAMDPGGQKYQAHLLEQMDRYLAKLPDSDGIAIDRLDMFVFYNPNADDGESWMDGRPVRSMLWSYKDLFEKLGPKLHNAGKVIFVNNHVKRIEMLKHVDGIYDEFSYSGEALNLTAFHTLRRPGMGWTASEDDFKGDPDAYFQRFLYLGIFPTVPFPENDHTVRPGEFADKCYLEYGPMFRSIFGRKWVLEPHAVTVKDNAAKANLFEVSGEYIMPIVFGGNASSVTVTVRNIEDLKIRLSGFTCQALHPDSEKWVSVQAIVEGEKVIIDVPIKRGCAVVKLSRV